VQCEATAASVGHVVVFVQENHTTDNCFRSMRAWGANVAADWPTQPNPPAKDQPHNRAAYAKWLHAQQAGSATPATHTQFDTSQWGVPAVVALAAAGDGFSTWILGRAGGGALGPRLAGLATSLGPLGPGLVFIVAILGIFAALAQVALMLVRVGVLVMLTGVLPLVAAGSGTRTGRATLTRVLSWLLAFVLYKPAAAVVYASAFYLVGQGSDPLSVLSGLALMVLSIVALPALLRLLTPAVAAATSGGGGGGAVAAGAVVAATGARIVSQRTPAGGGAGSAAGGGAGSGGSGPSAGPSGAGPTGGPGTKSGSPAGAAGAGSGAGSAGAVLAVAGAAMTAAEGAADATTELGGGS